MAAVPGGNELNKAEMIRFDVLPDDVLLDIFDFYTDKSSYRKMEVETWQILVHVCQRWRSLVFKSPRRLNLRLVCTPETRTRNSGALDIWPALPLIVLGEMASPSGTDNVIAALEHSNRVCQIFLWDLADKYEEFSAAMQVPFPELTVIYLRSKNERLAVIPVLDSFLGGSAPRLQKISLNGIPFQGLPNLLLSATHLVDLWLFNIPPSGYISPEAIVTLLCVSSSLSSFSLEFQYPQYLPDRETRPPPPPKHSILPALEHFTFNGTTEYLEDLVSRIDAPQLSRLQVEFYNQINFDCPRLTQFINRIPKHQERDIVHLQYDEWTIGVLFGILQMVITCSEPDLRLSSVAQICSSFIPSTVEGLYIERRLPRSRWWDYAIEITWWLQLLLPFAKVKNLYIYKEFAPDIAATLKELVGDRITEVLPSLQNIFVEELGPFEEDIGQFVVARRLSGRPISISEWDNDSGTKSM